MQMSLALDPPRARRMDPATSHAAAGAARELARQHHQVILACLVEHGPLGKDGISARTGLPGVAVARRLPELQAAGLVELTGWHCMSNAGRAEREWRAVR